MQHQIPISHKEPGFGRKDIQKWFKGQGFRQVEFTNGKAHVSTLVGEPLTFKLLEREQYDTFYKEAYGGAILVFECAVEEGILKYESYAPIWLFGIWTLKKDFNKNPSGMYKYLGEGNAIEEKFQKYLNKKN